VRRSGWFLNRLRAGRSGVVSLGERLRQGLARCCKAFQAVASWAQGFGSAPFLVLLASVGNSNELRKGER
jgi:hypothetical protein